MGRRSCIFLCICDSPFSVLRYAPNLPEGIKVSGCSMSFGNVQPLFSLFGLVLMRQPLLTNSFCMPIYSPPNEDSRLLCNYTILTRALKSPKPEISPEYFAGALHRPLKAVRFPVVPCFPAPLLHPPEEALPCFFPQSGRESSPRQQKLRPHRLYAPAHLPPLLFFPFSGR